MQKNPKISVITVVYNGIEHLEQTIQSVLAQTYDNTEYIIIDGGSTDGTVELLKKYEDQIAYWVSETDAGIYDAMNKGIAKATGEIVGLINADDWYEKGAISAVVDTFLNTDADVVHGSMKIVKESGESFIKIANHNISNLKKGMLLNHPTVFAKKSLYDQYGGFDNSYRIVADWELMLRWLLNGVVFVATEKTLANFRMGGVSSEHLKKSFIEKHRVRQKHKVCSSVDWYYVYDKIKSVLPANLLLEISLKRQKKVGSKC